MKILIAPQAFKGTYTAFEVGKAIERGIRAAYPDAVFVLLPISDGGDGFLEVMFHIKPGTPINQTVTGPLGNKVTVQWGMYNESPTAVIELAKIAGLTMIPPDRRDPSMTTTYGVGEVICTALDEGTRHFLIGIGGSGTNDAGTGIIQALGGKFLDSKGVSLPLGGAALERLDKIDLSNLDSRILNSVIVVGCDVKNTITGLEGASLVYAEQKGADSGMIAKLERGLQRFTDVVKDQYDIDLNRVEGSGAAGGVGGGLHALLDAKLTSGIDLVLDQMDFDRHLKGASLVITGEGRMDAQTVYGKGPIVVAQRAKKRDIPVYAFVGSLGEGYEAVYDHGITKVIPL